MDIVFEQSVIAVSEELGDRDHQVDERYSWQPIDNALEGAERACNTRRYARWALQDETSTQAAFDRVETVVNSVADLKVFSDSDHDPEAVSRTFLVSLGGNLGIWLSAGPDDDQEWFELIVQLPRWEKC